MPPPRADVFALLRTLRRHDVRFIVVGGVAAVLHGAPVATFDLDIVHDRSPDNVENLLRALRELSARYRDTAGRQISPDATHLQGSGHNLFVTAEGPLDVLGVIGNGQDYTALRSRSHDVDIEADLRVGVLDLEAQVELKRDSGREKDRAMLPTLMRTLQERRRKD